LEGVSYMGRIPWHRGICLTSCDVKVQRRDFLNVDGGKRKEGAVRALVLGTSIERIRLGCADIRPRSFEPVGRAAKTHAQEGDRAKKS